MNYEELGPLPTYDGKHFMIAANLLSRLCASIRRAESTLGIGEEWCDWPQDLKNALEDAERYLY